MCRYSYFTDAVPWMFEEKGTLHTEITTMLGLFLLFNLMFNYISCSWIGPGYPPEVITSDQLTALADDPDIEHGNHRYCKKCEIVKGMRTHHCSMCGKCVCKMDHHCPWINNCVGYRNHKFFLLFLFYMWLACLFFLVNTLNHT